MDKVTTCDYFGIMRAIGIKELKAKLSHYVQLVRAGEVLLVTDRDKVVAELRPPGRPSYSSNTLQESLDGLAEAGEVSRSRLAKGRWTWRTDGLGLPAGTASTLLEDLRADRSGE